MPSFPADMPGAAGGAGGLGLLAGANPYVMGGMLALEGGSKIMGMISGRKQKKRLKDREDRILREIDSGASIAKGDAMAGLGAAQGTATQGMIGRGLVNSSAAADAASGAAAGVGQQMGQITQQAARDKAQVMGDFAGLDAGGGGGGTGMSGTGAAIGALLASNLGGGSAATQPPGSGSLTGQTADKPDSIMLRGGDQGLTSDSIGGAYDKVAMPAQAADLPAANFDALAAVKNARGARGGMKRKRPMPTL